MSAGFKPVLSPGDLQTERDIFVNRHVAKQGVILKNETDPPGLNSEASGVLIVE